MENKGIVDFLIGVGVKPNLKGFGYLYQAIRITIENNCRIPQVTKYLYPEIAELYNDTASRVERAMRHAIETSETDYRYMSCSEFIATAALMISF